MWKRAFLPTTVLPILLKNLANTLGGPFLAAGLAAEVVENHDEFLRVARGFAPPDGFGAQYEDRLETIEEFGIVTIQAPFWKLEAECRHRFDEAALGLRLISPGSHR